MGIRSTGTSTGPSVGKLQLRKVEEERRYEELEWLSSFMFNHTLRVRCRRSNFCRLRGLVADSVLREQFG